MCCRCPKITAFVFLEKVWKNNQNNGKYFLTSFRLASSSETALIAQSIHFLHFIPTDLTRAILHHKNSTYSTFDINMIFLQEVNHLTFTSSRIFGACTLFINDRGYKSREWLIKSQTTMLLLWQWMLALHPKKKSSKNKELVTLFEVLPHLVCVFWAWVEYVTHIRQLLSDNWLFLHIYNCSNGRPTKNSAVIDIGFFFSVGPKVTERVNIELLKAEHICHVYWFPSKISSLSVLTFTLSIRETTPLKRVPTLPYPNLIRSIKNQVNYTNLHNNTNYLSYPIRIDKKFWSLSHKKSKSE